MAYNESLSDRIREALAEAPGLEEKRMFGGVCYMVDGKMCIGVMKEELMCRVGPEAYEAALEEPGCREMAFTGRKMNGYVLVDAAAVRSPQELGRWVQRCLGYNRLARPAKKKNKRMP